jgi:hypothetical protein
MIENSRRQLVQRFASSAYLNKSARLREMFLYLSGRVLEDGADSIHEQEVGHKVFGRPEDYDTAADNIVRVHASMLRKRSEQYFANEGRREPIIFEIPKGNYAPVFRKRPAATPEATIPIDREVETAPVEAPIPPTVPRWDWRTLIAAGLAAIFAFTTVFLLVRSYRHSANAPFASQPTVRQFWSQVFPVNTQTDVVLDDASLGLYQELTGREIRLAEYFDRSYLRTVEDSAVAGKLDPDFVKALILKRQSSYADSALFWKLNQIAGTLGSGAKTHFSRDYSFREIKVNNVVLLGNVRSNPWIEPFETHLSMRWKYDKALGGHYPVDTLAPAAEAQKFRIDKDPNKPHEGYASVSLLPNLSGTGKVLIISATGGSAMTAALDFLSDENSLSQLRSRLTKSTDFPNFEALLKVESRSALPRDTSIIICRSVK